MVRERKDIASQLEWEQMLQESGVKVLEIYERWCGPCQSLPDYIQSNYTALIEQIIPRKTSITSIKERSSSSPSSSHHVVVDEDDSSQLTQYTTCSDSIDQFRKYVGHCRPILMIYNGRTLCHTIENGFDFVALEKSLRVAIQIRDKTAVYDSGKAGSKSPKEIQRKERFAGENASLPSSMMDTQRTVYDVPLEGSERSESLEKIILETGERIDERHWVVPEPIPVSLSAVIIKPNIASDPNICDKIVERLLSGHADQPIQQRTSFNVTIYQQERTVLRPDVIMSSDLSSGMTADQKDRLRKLMLGGESIVMLLIVGATGTCGFEYLRSICGPREPALARQQEPQSLRALYGGADLVDNAVHISENTESASQLISLLYPRLDTAYVAGGIPLNKFHQDQRTLCIIRPSAYMRFEKEIKEDIMNNGFEIAFEKSYNMRFDEAKHIYSMHRNKHYFDDLIAEMTCASALILCLSKVNAVEDFRKIIGPSTMDRILLAPDSLRYKYSDRNSMINCLHGSSTSEAANREIEMFFPVQKTVGLIKPGYSEEIVRQVIIAAKKAKFSIIASKTMTLSELQVDKMYDAHQFMPWFKNFKSYMCQSGPCFVLVMLREDAVAAWRQLIGPTDPKQAIAEAPQSLRARFGTDIMRNCLHGASHPVKANETIRELFGTDRNSGPGASTNDDHGNTIVGNKRSGGNEVTTMGNAAGVNEISINSTSVGAAMPGDKLDFVSLKGLKENYLEVAEVEKQAKSLVSAMKAERTYGEHNSDNTGKPIDQCIYEVIIYTYYRQGSKEPPNVYIILEGQNGAVTPRILLNCPLSGQYPFLTGAVDKFRIYGPDVGPIRQIMLCRNTQLTNSTNIGNVEQMIPLTQLPCFPSYWYVKIIEIIHVPTQACYVVDVDSLIGGECFDSKNLKTSSNTTNLIGSNDSDAAGGAAGSNAAGGTQASNSIGNRTSILRSTTNKNENECVYLSSVIATSAQVAAPVTESEMDMIERESINSMPGPPVKELSITEHKGILILVQTSGERKYSGTKSAARLTLLDGNKRKHVVSLEQSINSNPSPLERGQRSYFAVDLKDIRHLGKIDRIIIGQKQVRSAPAWFIDFIAIFDCRSGIDEEIYFPVYRWLDERYADRKTEITLYKNQPNSDYDYKIIDQIAKESAMKIEVITCTGWAFADAGTNASIRFVLFAGQGESTAVLDTFLEIAENNAQPFEVGSVDIFRFYIDKGSKEAVSSFQLSVEDETSDVGWFLEAIYLRINDNEEYKISVYRWLDSEAKGGNKITVNLKDYQEEFIPEDLLTYDQLYPEVPKLRLLNDLVPRKTTYLLTIHTIKRIPTTVRPSRFFAEIIGDRPAFGPEDQLRYQTSGPMELLINLEQGVLATQSISEFTLAGKPVDHPAKLRLSMRSCVKHLKDVVPLENWTIGNVLCKIGELEILFRFNQTIDPSVIRFTDAKALINF